MRTRGHAEAAPAPAGPGGEPATAAQPSGPIVQLQSAQTRIARQVVWSDVDLEVAPGEFTAILGPNGSGKTTLLRVLLGELPVTAGRVSVLGRAPGAANREIGYLP